VLPGEEASPAEPDATEVPEEEFATTHPLLAQYFPSERRAIVVHWFFLCADENRRVPGSEAIGRWEGGPAKSWRKRKFWEDMHVQLNEIDRHKYLLSEKAGRDVGWEFAAEDWIRKYSADWRAWWEQHCDPH
jgi:hypothetical protein